MGRGGGLEALWLPSSSGPGSSLRVRGGTTVLLNPLLWKETGTGAGEYFLVQCPQPPGWCGQLSQDVALGKVGGQVGGTDEGGSFRAVAKAKCYFLFKILGHESSRGCPGVFRVLR